MSEDKKTLIDLVPDSVDNAVKNITDKPAQNIGTTLADIWYLVFGGISHAAEKRKLKYSYALQEFENELKEKISKIPEDKLAEPDIQIIAQALEKAKYCVEEEILRNMFSNLISNSLNKDKYVHPLYINIIYQLSSSDAKILKKLFEKDDISVNLKFNKKSKKNSQLLTTISILEHNGLITSDIHDKFWRDSFGNINSYNELFKADSDIRINFTEIGRSFCKICLG